MLMKSKLPIRLKKEPLIEALWEIRFSSQVESVVELLPGLIYHESNGEYKKITRLPTANLPDLMLQQNPDLKYVPSVRLDGEPYSIQIGEHVVSLSCHRPYSGWMKFGEKIRRLSQILRATNLLTTPERFSLKYIDIVPGDDTPSISLLAVELKLGDHNLVQEPVHLRTEIREKGFIHVVQVASPVDASLPTGEKYTGVLLDIDTISTAQDQEFWSNFDSQLDLAHELNKNLFFRLITENTIQSLEPEY